MSKSSRVQLNIAAAETALKELIAEGKKPSQYAVEMRAGLSNGTLNYKCDEYENFKKRLITIKKSQPETNDLYKQLKKECQKQSDLKDKYRNERNFFKEENKVLHAQNKELLYQLFLIQQEMIQVKEKNVIDFNAIRFEKRDK